MGNFDDDMLIADGEEQSAGPCCIVGHLLQPAGAVGWWGDEFDGQQLRFDADDDLACWGEEEEEYSILKEYRIPCRKSSK